MDTPVRILNPTNVDMGNQVLQCRGNSYSQWFLCFSNTSFHFLVFYKNRVYKKLLDLDIIYGYNISDKYLIIYSDQLRVYSLNMINFTFLYSVDIRIDRSSGYQKRDSDIFVNSFFYYVDDSIGLNVLDLKEGTTQVAGDTRIYSVTKYKSKVYCVTSDSVLIISGNSVESTIDASSLGLMRVSFLYQIAVYKDVIYLVAGEYSNLYYYSNGEWVLYNKIEYAYGNGVVSTGKNLYFYYHVSLDNNRLFPKFLNIDTGIVYNSYQFYSLYDDYGPEPSYDYSNKMSDKVATDSQIFYFSDQNIIIQDLYNTQTKNNFSLITTFLLIIVIVLLVTYLVLTSNIPYFFRSNNQNVWTQNEI